MPSFWLRSNYDSESTAVSTRYRVFDIPALKDGEAYFVYGAAVDWYSEDTPDIWSVSNTINRMEVHIGGDLEYYQNSDDPVKRNRILCIPRDYGGSVSAIVSFQRPGLFEQVVRRQEPFRENRIVVAARLAKGGTNFKCSASVRLDYSIVSMTLKQQVEYDVSGIWVE